VKPTERVARIPAVSDGVASKSPSETYSSLLAHSATGAALGHIEHHQEYSGERKEISLEDWSVPKRPWLKYVAAAALIAALAGGWFFYGRGALAARAAASPAPAATIKPPEASLATKGAIGPIVKDSAAVQTPPAAPKPEPVAPPAAPPERAARNAAADDNEPAAPPTKRSLGTALPTVNVDRIMKAIDDSARAQRDSASKSLNVSAPVFKAKPPPTPPASPR
jgi:predicted component of type VI protein secretion system